MNVVVGLSQSAVDGVFEKVREQINQELNVHLGLLQNGHVLFFGKTDIDEPMKDWAFNLVQNIWEAVGHFLSVGVSFSRDSDTPQRYTPYVFDDEGEFDALMITAAQQRRADCPELEPQVIDIRA